MEVLELIPESYRNTALTPVMCAQAPASQRRKVQAPVWGVVLLPAQRPDFAPGQGACEQRLARQGDHRGHRYLGLLLSPARPTRSRPSVPEQVGLRIRAKCPTLLSEPPWFPEPSPYLSSGQGRSPFLPMPIFWDTATMQFSGRTMFAAVKRPLPDPHTRSAVKFGGKSQAGAVYHQHS